MINDHAATHTRLTGAVGKSCRRWRSSVHHAGHGMGGPAWDLTPARRVGISSPNKGLFPPRNMMQQLNEEGAYAQAGARSERIRQCRIPSVPGLRPEATGVAPEEFNARSFGNRLHFALVFARRGVFIGCPPTSDRWTGLIREKKIWP